MILEVNCSVSRGDKICIYLAKTIKSTLEFRRLLFHYLKNRDSCIELGQKSKLFIESQAGATELSVPLLIKDLK